MSSTIVDGFAFCRHGEQRSGTTPVTELPRLAAETASPGGAVRWSFEGSRHVKGYPQLSMTVTGEVSLLCQRCLLPMPQTFETHALLVLAPDEAEADATEQALDDDRMDVIVSHDSLDLLQLVEDEVLLSLPLSPRHATCPNRESGLAPEPQPSPFSVLKRLKD